MFDKSFDKSNDDDILDVGLEHFYRDVESEVLIKSNNIIMNSKIWSLKLRDVSGAVVSAVISAILVYLANLTNLADLNWEQVLGIAVTVGASSLLKAFSTNNEGDFLGAVNIK